MNPRENPFAPGAGTTPPELAGRDKVIEDVAVALHRIRNGLSAKSVLMVGLRGVGKTVLLNRLKNDAEAEGIVCAQFESLENRNLPAMIVPTLRAALLKLDRVAGAVNTAGNAVAKAAKTLGSFISAAKFKYDDMEFGFDLGKEVGVADTGDLDYDLSDLFQSIGIAAKEKQTAVVLFIDELQYVPAKQLASLITALHACAQKKLPISLVGAGLPQLVGNVGKAKSYAERLFDFPLIGALTDAAAIEALQRPVAGHQVEFTQEAVNEILHQTKGYPYFLQEWGSHAWAVASTSPISKDDAQLATQLAITQLDSSFFRVRFDRCTPMEKVYMRAMAEIGTPAPRSGDIAAVMKKEVNQLGPLRQSLITKGMIYSPAHGDTAFTVPLFAEYMKRTMAMPS
jgi:AAA ATPase domain